MNKPNSMNYTLLSVLLTMVACDEAQIGADDEGLGEVEPRCSGAACQSTGNLGNTNFIGNFGGQHMPKDFNQWAANPGGALRITSAKIAINNVDRTVTHWNVDNEGELHLFYQVPGVGEIVVSDEATTGARFYFEYDPDVDPNFLGMLKLHSVSCEFGQVDPTFKVCNYLIVTDVPSSDPVRFPEITPGSGLWTTCEDNDDGGTLDDAEKFSVVIAKNTTLDLTTAPGVVSLNPSIDLLACRNGAVSKPEALLQVTNDWKYDKHPTRALDPSQPNALVRAFMAIVNGETTTIPGQTVCFHDAKQGRFNTNNCSANMMFEGAYGEEGLVYRNGFGVHRLHADPSEIEGWDALPVRDGTNYYVDPGDPSIGVWTIPAN